MSATVVKANRRDLRRAVGEEAVQMVEAHEHGLRAHAASLTRHEQLHDLSLKAREALHKELHAEIQLLAETVFPSTWRGLLRLLRRLVFGR